MKIITGHTCKFYLYMFKDLFTFFKGFVNLTKKQLTLNKRFENLTSQIGKRHFFLLYLIH